MITQLHFSICGIPWYWIYLTAKSRYYILRSDKTHIRSH